VSIVIFERKLLRGNDPFVQMMTSPSYLPTDPLHNGLSPFVCACFTLNYLIGTGFLTLPWAFDMSGLLLSTLTMAFTSLIACVASDYILSAMARADALAVLLETHEEEFDGEASKLLAPSNKTSYQSVEAPDNVELAKNLAVELDDILDYIPDDVNGDYYEHIKEHGKLLVGERKFELTELVRGVLAFCRRIYHGLILSLTRSSLFST
jgi:hypothetical protein